MSTIETIATDTEKGHRVRQVVWSYFKMLMLGVGLTWLAIMLASYLNEFHPLLERYKTIFEYFGYVCWVTSLGENGLALLTWGRKSRAERFDKRMAQIVSLLGVFAFVFARELKPI